MASRSVRPALCRSAKIRARQRGYFSRQLLMDCSGRFFPGLSSPLRLLGRTKRTDLLIEGNEFLAE